MFSLPKSVIILFLVLVKVEAHCPYIGERSCSKDTVLMYKPYCSKEHSLKACKRHECHTKTHAKSLYCFEHTDVCKIDGCKNLADSYCAEHQGKVCLHLNCFIAGQDRKNNRGSWCSEHKPCKADISPSKGCVESRESGTNYCIKHVCGRTGCGSKVAGPDKKACSSHKCKFATCVDPKEQGKEHCEDHTRKAREESEAKNCTVHQCKNQKVDTSNYCPTHKCSITGCLRVKDETDTFKRCLECKKTCHYADANKFEQSGVCGKSIRMGLFCPEGHNHRCDFEASNPEEGLLKQISNNMFVCPQTNKKDNTKRCEAHKLCKKCEKGLHRKGSEFCVLCACAMPHCPNEGTRLYNHAEGKEEKYCNADFQKQQADGKQDALRAFASSSAVGETSPISPEACQEKLSGLQKLVLAIIGDAVEVGPKVRNALRGNSA